MNDDPVADQVRKLASELRGEGPEYFTDEAGRRMVRIWSPDRDVCFELPEKELAPGSGAAPGRYTSGDTVLSIFFDGRHVFRVYPGLDLESV